jgi:hypothetical protein
MRYPTSESSLAVPAMSSGTPHLRGKRRLTLARRPRPKAQSSTRRLSTCDAPASTLPGCPSRATLSRSAVYSQRSAASRAPRSEQRRWCVEPLPLAMRRSSEPSMRGPRFPRSDASWASLDKRSGSRLAAQGSPIRRSARTALLRGPKGWPCPSLRSSPANSPHPNRLHGVSCRQRPRSMWGRPPHHRQCGTRR